MSDQVVETSQVDVAIEASDPREHGNWSSWEIKRTRSFLKPGPGKLDDRGKVGEWRNLSLELAVWREGAGFKGEWKVTWETHVHGRRLARDGRVTLALKQGTSAVISVPATGIATRCHGWETQGWTGSLTPEQLEAINQLTMTSGEIELKKC